MKAEMLLPIDDPNPPLERSPAQRYPWSWVAEIQQLFSAASFQKASFSNEFYVYENGHRVLGKLADV